MTRVSKKFFSFFRSMASDIHGKGILRLGEDWLKTDLCAATVGDEVHLLLAQRSVEAKEPARHGVAAISRFQLRGTGAYRRTSSWNVFSTDEGSRP